MSFHPLGPYLDAHVIKTSSSSVDQLFERILFDSDEAGFCYLEAMRTCEYTPN